MKRILIVEDNLLNLELAAVILELDYEVLEAENGQEGVDEAQKEKPDLILMDISMPVLDGFGALEKIRADPQIKDTPVVAFTAHALKTDREKIDEAGFDGYVTKPVDGDMLIAEIERLLGAT